MSLSEKVRDLESTIEIYETSLKGIGEIILDALETNTKFREMRKKLKKELKKYKK